jgi:hypothetical protein
VRSTYNFAWSSDFYLTHTYRGRLLYSTYNEDEKASKAIWKINAPNNMKIDVWRFAHDCLPSGFQLTHRHILICDSCVFCGREETMQHSLLLCQHAQKLWWSGIRLHRTDFMSTKSWLFEFLSETMELEAKVLAVWFWHIWETRNVV